jgi:hypothetical protein
MITLWYEQKPTKSSTYMQFCVYMSFYYTNTCINLTGKRLWAHTFSIRFQLHCQPLHQEKGGSMSHLACMCLAVCILVAVDYSHQSAEKKQSGSRRWPDWRRGDRQKTHKKYAQDSLVKIGSSSNEKQHMNVHQMSHLCARAAPRLPHRSHDPPTYQKSTSIWRNAS